MRHLHHSSVAPRRGRPAAVFVAVALLATACSAGMASPSTLPPRSSGSSAATLPATGGPRAPVVPSTASTVSTSAPASTVAARTSTTAVPVSLFPASPIDSTTVLSADGPWTRVDGAPGVGTAGLFYELAPQVWVYLPQAEDLPNGIVWTLRDDTRPIIEAYLTAQAARWRAGANVVLRPQVLGDDRSDSTALVADCVTSVGAATRTGWGASLIVDGSDWVVDSQGPREDACWFG